MVREQDLKINWLGGRGSTWSEPRTLFPIERSSGSSRGEEGASDHLLAAIREALASDDPTIVDAVVIADELPNLPYLDLALVGRVAQAKVREAILAVTGA